MGRGTIQSTFRQRSPSTFDTTRDVAVRSANMRRIFCFFVFVISFLPAHAQDVTKYSSETILQLIGMLERDPMSERGAAARSVILDFAEKSDTVMVEVSERAMPWVEDSSVPEGAQLVLTAAYVAGNVKSQLERKVNANDSMAGWKQVFSAYDALRKHSPGIRVRGVEVLLEEEKSGQLKARALELDGQGKDRV